MALTKTILDKMICLEKNPMKCNWDVPKAERHVFEALILTELKLIYWQTVLVLKLRAFVLLIAEKNSSKSKHTRIDKWFCWETNRVWRCETPLRINRIGVKAETLRLLSPGHWRGAQHHNWENHGSAAESASKKAVSVIFGKAFELQVLLFKESGDFFGLKRGKIH